MRLIPLSMVLILLLPACGDSGAAPGGGGGSAGTAGSSGTPGGVMLSHTFDALSIGIDPKDREISNLCQSWVLNNEEPLYVSRVRQSNGGGWHHSNWFFVPDWSYPPNPEVEGPDATQEGTWKCNDRAFREYLAAAGGGVFFAQSTQTMTEEQVFPEGAVLELPPHSMIVGDVHLLNITAGPLQSAMTFELETIPRDQVSVRLTPFSFSNTSLQIPPQRESRFSMTCDLTDTFELNFGEMPEYKVYYVLAHYHEWGNYFNLSFTQQDGSRDTIMELSNRVGEPIGKTIDPPMSSRGAPAITVDCGYLNNTDETLTYGLGGHEMCVFLAYTDSNLKVGASGGANHEMGEDPEGVALYETDCGQPITGFRAFPDEP